MGRMCERIIAEGKLVYYKHVDLFLVVAILKVVTSNIYIAYAISPNLLGAPEVSLSSTNQRRE